MHAAWFAVAGVVAFLAGAGLASSAGAWNLDGQAYLAAVAGAPDAWRYGHAMLAAGAALTAAGMALLAPLLGHPGFQAGRVLWVAAGAAGVVGFALQGEGALAAAGALRGGGGIPPGFASAEHWKGLAIGAFIMLGLLGSASLGAGLHAAAMLSPSMGAAGVAVFVAGGLFLLLGIPAGVVFPAAWLAAAVLLQGGAAP